MNADDDARQERGPSDDIEDLLRALSAEDAELISPPPDLWGRIEEAVDADTDSVEKADPGNNVVSLDQRRRPRGAVLVAAAAAVILLAGIGLTVANRQPSVQPLAGADLTYDPANFDPLGADSAATARLFDDDGTFTVQIEEAVLPTTADAELEVWLIEPDADGNPVDLVSLGTIDPDNPAALTVPASHDPDQFYVVDISIEPRDGDPTHSGRSILRGPLTDA